MYSLSWCPNPEFSSIFPAQNEILEYLQRIAQRHHVASHIQLRTEWKGAHWSEKAARWHVYLEDLDTGRRFLHVAKILVSAVGGYTNPKYPTLPGVENFDGSVVHTANWDKNYDLKGKNVVIIGNGCRLNR